MKHASCTKLLLARLVGSMGVALWGSTAWAAPTAAACIEASDDGQALRKNGEYVAAREQLRVCAQESCPGVVRKNCFTWLGQLDESIPTLVVAASDAAGQDVANATLSVDGKVVAERLDGKAVALDPGEHTLLLEAADGSRATLAIVARVGEHNRLVRMTLVREGGAVEPTPTAESPSAPASAPTKTEGKGAPVAALVVGGIGVAAMAGFTVLGLTAKSRLNELRDTCAPGCAQDDLDSVKSRMLLADLSLAVGVAALGTAGVLLIHHLTSGDDTAASGKAKAGGVVLAPAPIRGGGSLLLDVTF